jgi:hypothetical protein
LTVRDPRTERLKDAVDAYRARIEPRVQAGTPSQKAAYEECESLLTKAKQSLDEGGLNLGWSLAHEAERAEIGGLDDPQLKARVIALRNEVAEKLREWRRKAALELLGDNGGKNPPTADEVREALRVRNEHFENLYYKIKVSRLQLLVLGVALLVTLVTLLFVLWRSSSMIGDLGWLEFLRVMLAGALGGALSAVRSLGGGGGRKIPEQLADWPITAMRPLLGAATGTGAALLLAAGILDFGKEDYRDAALLAAAFVAGFSERWFLGVIGGVGKSE